GLADALTGAADDDALEDLDTGAAALDDVHVHLDGVAGAELGDVGTQRGGVDVVEDVHGSFALCARHRSNAGIKKVGVRRASRSHGSPVAGPCGSTRSNSAIPGASPATRDVSDRRSARPSGERKRD